MSNKTPEELERLHQEFNRLRATLPESISFGAILGYVYGDDRAMYLRSGGLSFEQLCGLIGKTAGVERSEAEYYDGWREHTVEWRERVTIREFLGAVRYLEPVWGYFGEEPDIIDEVWVAHPHFRVENRHGKVLYVVFEDLQDIQPAG